MKKYTLEELVGMDLNKVKPAELPIIVESLLQYRTGMAVVIATLLKSIGPVCVFSPKHLDQLIYMANEEDLRGTEEVARDCTVRLLEAVKEAKKILDPAWQEVAHHPELQHLIHEKISKGR